MGKPGQLVVGLEALLRLFQPEGYEGLGAEAIPLDGLDDEPGKIGRGFVADRFPGRDTRAYHIYHAGSS